MYRTCPSCGRGNLLAATDEHDCCFSCLGAGHLYAMATCFPCPSMCAKDHLERARRFAWWKYQKTLLSAKGIRSLLQRKPIPKILEQENLERYYLIHEVESDAEETSLEQEQSQQVQQAIPPQRAPVKRSLLLGGPGPRGDKPTRSTGATPLDPVTLSSPEYDLMATEDSPDFGDDEDVMFSPPQLDLLSQELKETKEQQRRDQERV